MVTQIKVELVERGMEQKDLADQVGINRVTMSHYMTSKRSIPMPTFIKIAQVLGVTPGALMDRAYLRVEAQPTSETA